VTEEELDQTMREVQEVLDSHNITTAVIGIAGEEISSIRLRGDVRQQLVMGLELVRSAAVELLGMTGMGFVSVGSGRSN